MTPARDPKPGEVLLSSREVEAAARGPDGQFRPELAIGGPSWPRDREQSTAKHGWKLLSSQALATILGIWAHFRQLPRFRALSII